jgi:hypothetical protein
MDIGEIERKIQSILTRESTQIADDQTLYHYTDCRALLQIVENNELWLTQREFMNDVFERSYANSILERAFRTVYEDDFQDPYDSFVERMLPDFHKQYVFSLSTERDLISQWTYYGGSDGYSLSFKLKNIVEAFRVLEIDFDSGQVIYQEKNQLEILETLISYTRYLQENKDLIEDYVGLSAYADSLIVLYHSLFKQSNNYSEHEFRILVKNRKNVFFKVRKGVVTPFTKITSQTPLPIGEIMIGPRINDTIAEEGLNQFLESLSSRIRVSRSNLRIR